MADVSEIAPDIYRISVYVPEFNLQFNHFLVKDEEPLLFHTGYKTCFSEVRDGVASILDPSRIRWIGFSHFESDECGSLNDWLALAPNAQAVCSFVGARTSVGDFAMRAPRVLEAEERLDTGSKRFRVIETKHVPHGWDASLMFEETSATLFCSDLFGHSGEVEPIIEGDIVGRTTSYTEAQQQGPMSHSIPFTPETRTILDGLADLGPKTLACMHGSSYAGDAATALRDLGGVLERVYGAD